MMTRPLSTVHSDAGAAVCPLCGGRAQATEGVVEAKITLLACACCRAFVMEKRLIDVFANARLWNLRPVLRHVASLSRAAQQAAAHGTVLSITSTNWIRLSNEQQRLDEIGASDARAVSLT